MADRATGGTKVFDVPLTADVYAAAASIEQLAVLDANGEPQSFFRRSPPPAAPTEQGVVLEASPLYVGGAAAGAPSVGVTTSERGTSVTVTPGAAAAPAITGFVLDARAVTTAPIALELDWRALPQPFLLEVSVEQSSDLTIGAGRPGSIASPRDRRRAGAPCARTRARRSRRLSARHAEPRRRGLALVARHARELGDRTRDAVERSRGAGRRERGYRKTQCPTRSISMPAERCPWLRFRSGFAAGDGWARADVATSRSLDGPWTPVAYRELFYELSFEGREFASTPVVVGRQEARYWRVVPAAPLRSERVELELTFPQEYLRVAVSGGAPYLLAAGTLTDEAGPDATLAQVWSRLTPPADVVPFAALGARRELGGPAALIAARVFPWRTAALWGVLILGVLVVATMAVRLAREMRSQPS